MVEEKKKIIIDTDFGIDDALAISFLEASKKFEILAITMVAGNSKMEVISENCKRLLVQLSIDHIPLYESGSYNLLGKFIVSDGYYGDNAFADIELPKYETFQKQSIPSPQALVHYVRKYPGEVHIFCIGPLTNLALAFFLDNEFPSLVGSITIMGTDSNETTILNVTDFAEFNCHCDALSYYVVNKCFGKVPRPILISEWNINTSFPFPYSSLEELQKHHEEGKSNIFTKLFLQLSDKTNPYLAKNHWKAGFMCADLCAAVVFYEPSVVLTKKRVSLDVVINDDTKHGHAVYTEDPNGVFELVTSVDNKRMGQILTDVFKQ